MKIKLLFILTIIFSSNSYSQINFEKGYYIDKTNQKVNCLIKNIDWKYNPTEFEYKLLENDEIKLANLEDVKEFSIENVSKYVRATVNIDRSSENINSLSHEKNPIFNEETLFLKVLVEGKSNLYEYTAVNLNRFFYKTENSNIEQLVFKSYQIDQSTIGKNFSFRQQLWANLKCSSFKESRFKNINYKRNELVKIFIDYSNCNNSEPVTLQQKGKRDLFNLTIRPRLNSSSMTINDFYSNSKTTNFDTKIGFGLGLEAEYILPYNNNKWAFLIEPTYQSYNTEKTNEYDYASGGKAIINVDYSSIELPVGLRHYFYLNNSSKIFINASYVFDFALKSSIEVKRTDGSALNKLEMDTNNNLAFGIGYKQNKRYSLELRFQTNKDLLDNYLYWNSEYKTMSLIFGYTFL